MPVSKVENTQPIPRSGIDRRRTPAHNDPVLIRLPAVIAICAMSRSCIYEAIKNGTFPAPVKLNGRPSASIQQQVINWVNDRIHASRQA
ncbi:helix-turn-helix transcriptional regulator [Massilia sp. DWR3-1-1]|uniref:helix-turn-helix transcriptional regulator n=1 Tax=Massilia sp. DWR3-1-1 TaxID=2804559 RepID=UPI003CF2529D